MNNTIHGEYIYKDIKNWPCKIFPIIGAKCYDKVRNRGKHNCISRSGTMENRFKNMKNIS